jgi:hypothetical protein
LQRGDTAELFTFAIVQPDAAAFFRLLGPQPTNMSVPDNRTAVQQYLDDIAPASIVGRLIKFSKDGNFITNDDGVPVPPGAIVALTTPR